MVSRPRTQEKTIEPSSFGFRFFYLDEDIVEESTTLGEPAGALAWPCYYNEEGGFWDIVESDFEEPDKRVRIYCPAFGYNSPKDDVVLCWFDPVAQRWEILSDRQAVPFRNDSGEEVPEFAALQPTGAALVGQSKRITITKPDEDGAVWYLVNCSVRVPAGEIGVGYWLTDDTILQRHRVLYDSSAGTPLYGEIWGPKAGSWKLTKDKPGFLVFGGADVEEGTVIAYQLSATNNVAAVAALSDAMCGAQPGEEVAIENFCIVSGGGEFTPPTTAFNWFQRQGPSGNMVKLEYWLKDPTTCEPFGHWAITQVQARREDHIFDMRIKSDKTAIEVRVYENAVLESCKEPIWKDKIPLEQCDPA